MKANNIALKIFLPLLVLSVAIIGARAIIANKPEPFKRPQLKNVTRIEATRVTRTDYQVFIKTQGTVGAARDGSLVSQVTGTITTVGSNYASGGHFKSGEVLVQIDPRDYEIAQTMAHATRAQAQAALEEEKAKSEQAAVDWKRLGRKGKPSALTLRKPQLAAAHATLESANAQMQRAELDLTRTQITAPYDGRIAAINADLGQFVSKGSVLADIYSVDSAEVRLPLSSHQLAYVELPDHSDTQNSGDLTLFANIGTTRYEWPAKLVRTEGRIDPNSRQLYAIASVPTPYQTKGARPPLRVGQYVQARIAGITLKDVFVIPRAALREDREVLVIDEQNTLQRREVTVLWKDAKDAVIGAGLKQSEVISLTTLGSVVNGTQVVASIDGRPANAEPATTSNTKIGGKEAHTPQIDSGNNNQAARLTKLKAHIEAGGQMPSPVRKRMQQRLANGEPVPNWVKDYLNKGSN